MGVLKFGVAHVLAAALALAPTSALAGGSDPQVVLDEIYGQVNSMCGGEGNGRSYDLDVIAKQYFTPELRKLLHKAIASDDFGFDLLTDSQDCKLSDLKLSLVGGGEGSAIGRASFKNFDEPRTVDLIMTKKGGDWEVSDIVYRHREFSLKAAF